MSHSVSVPRSLPSPVREIVGTPNCCPELLLIEGLRTDDTRFLGNKMISPAQSSALRRRKDGNFPRVMQPRFWGAADKTLMKLEPPPEQVREYRKQAKARVENALSPVCQLAPHTGNRHGQQEEPSRRTAADDCSGTPGSRDSEVSQELRDYRRGKGDDVKLWGKDPSCICCRR